MKAVYLQFLSTISRHRMIGEGDRVLAAVSGGPDSVFLLHLLARFQKRLGIEKVTVAHVNYGKRGLDAGLDQEFVENLSEYLGFDLFVKIVSATFLNRVKKENFQKAARDVRYRFFRMVAKQTDSTKIAVGHTLDDQAETVLMRFLSGHGLKGMKGIPPITEDGIIRPLIDISKDEIQKCLSDENLGFRIDETNFARVYERNRIRNEIFPQLAKVTGRDVKRGVRDSGEIFRQINDVVDDLTQKAARSLFSKKGGVLNVKKFSGLPEIIRKSVLQKIGYEFLNRELNRRVLEKADSLLVREIPSFSMNLPGGYVLERSYDTARIVDRKEVDDFSLDVTIDSPGKYGVGGCGEALIVSLKKPSDIKPILRKLIKDKNIAAFDALSDRFPIKVKNFSEGDRIVPFGMERSKKLKKIFIERKVPREMRRKIPVVTIQNEIAWVPGIIRSALFPLGDKTEKIIVLEYKRN